MIGKVSGLWFPLAYFGFFYHIIREQIGPKVSQIDSVKPCVSVRLTEWNKFFCLSRLHLWVQAPRPLQFQQLVRICQEWTFAVTTLMHPSHNHFWYESVWSGRVSATMRIEKKAHPAPTRGRSQHHTTISSSALGSPFGQDSSHLKLSD